MNKSGSMLKLGMVTLVGAAMAFGIATLSSTPAHAIPPGPLCGPTYQWWCELPGCPDCYVTLFEGTICEKTAYEKKTGRVCHVEEG